MRRKTNPTLARGGDYPTLLQLMHHLPAVHARLLHRDDARSVFRSSGHLTIDNLCDSPPRRADRSTPARPGRYARSPLPAEIRGTPAGHSSQWCSAFHIRSARHPDAGSCRAKNNRDSRPRWSSRTPSEKWNPDDPSGCTGCRNPRVPASIYGRRRPTHRCARSGRSAETRPSLGWHPPEKSSHAAGRSRRLHSRSARKPLRY